MTDQTRTTSVSVERAHSPIVVEMRLLPCTLGQEDPDWRFARAAIPQLDGWLVELTSDCGAVGYGHIECLPAVSDTLDGALAAAEYLKPLVLDQNPLMIVAIMKQIEVDLHGHNHVKSGIDCALHELKARILQVPLHVLFGGATVQELETTRIIPLKSPDAMAENAVSLVGAGYRNLKVKLSGDAIIDIARVSEIRKAVGEKIRLSVDPNQAYSVRGAILTLKQLETLGVDLAEQPVEASNVTGLRQVREQVNMWVEADESVNSIPDAARVICAEAADSVNIKIADVGGLLNAKRIADLCHAMGVGYRLGAAFGPQILNAQAAHLTASFSSQFYPHELAEFEHFTKDPTSGLRVQQSKLEVPHLVGSGVVVNFG